MIEIWGVRLQDDVTAVSAKMASSIEHLDREVNILGQSFKKTNTGNLVIGLKEARMLFNSAGQNAKLFKAALKEAGTSALDARILINKMNSELLATRRHALGLDGIFARAFNPRTIWMMSHALNVASKSYGALQTVAGVGMRVGGEVYDRTKQGLASVIHHASQRQNAVAAMSYMYENPRTPQKKAEEMAGEDFRWAQRLAKDTPLDTPDVVQAMTQFTTAQFDRRQAKIMTQLAADQAAKFKNDPGMMGNVISAFSRMRGQGTSSRDLISLRVAGFNVERIVDEMRKLPELQKYFSGVKKDASPEEVKKAAKKALSTGMVSWQTMSQASINSVEFEKPNIGVMANKMGRESLEGAISNAENAWGDLIESVDSEKWDGLQQLIKFLNRVSYALDGDNEEGRTLLKTIEQATNNLMSGLSLITQSDITNFVQTLGEGALQFSKWLGEAWGWFEKLIHSDTSFIDTMEDALIDVGFFIGQGLWKGAKAAINPIAEDRMEKKYGISTGAANEIAERTGKTPGAVAREFAAKKKAYLASGRTLDEEAPSYGYRDFGEAADQSLVARIMAFKPGPGMEVGPLAPASVESQMQADIYGKMFQVGVWGGQGLYDGTVSKEGLDAHSPSRRMMEAGVMAADGLAEGVEKGGRRGALGGGGGPELHFHVGAGNTTAAQEWRELAPMVQREIAAMFRREASAA